MASRTHQVRKHPKTGVEYTVDTVRFRQIDANTGKKFMTSRTWTDSTAVAIKFENMLTTGVPVTVALAALGETPDAPRPRKQAARGTVGSETLVDWISRFIDGKPNRQAQNKARLRTYLTNDIEPFFGDTRLTEVTKVQMWDYVTWLKARPCQHSTGKLQLMPDGTPKLQKESTILNKWTLISSALEKAVILEMIPRDPSVGMVMDEPEKKEPNAFTREDFAIVLAAFRRPEYRVFIEFLVYSGLRFSEATALQSRDVHLDEERVFVWQVFEKNIGKPGYSLTPGTKNKKIPERDVYVLPEVLAKLDLTGEFVFTNGDGNPIKQSTFITNVWDKTIARVEREHRLSLRKTPTLHNLRASYATWANEDGMDIKVLQEQMGHSSLAMLEGHYLKTNADQKRKAVGMMRARHSMPTVPTLTVVPDQEAAAS